MFDQDKPPATRFPIPAATSENPHLTWTEERKSRFLAQCCHCETVGAARAFVAETRLRNPGATHNCWAFVAGPPGDTARIGSSDDGEPHGTAGMPMLKALLHGEAGEICIVVSRWFGGIKLGTGGLVRAYQGAVLDNLATLPLVERMDNSAFRLFLDYEALDAVKRLLAQSGGSIEDARYHSGVELLVNMPLDNAENFRKEALNVARGRLRMEDAAK